MNFVGTEKRVRIIHGKRAVRVGAIEVVLYVITLPISSDKSTLVISKSKGFSKILRDIRISTHQIRKMRKKYNHISQMNM